MKEELEWIRKNPKGRQAKSKARVQAFEELASQEFQKRSETKEIYIPPGPRLGDLVIEVKDLKKGFGDRVLYEGLNFRVPRGAIVGIIGANGRGKTTLFRMLVGQDRPDGGEIRIGETVKFAYVDQSRDLLDGDKTLYQELSGGNDLLRVGGYEIPARAWIGRFNFKGADQQKRVKELSGGERNRAHLAKVLQGAGNVLLLDEPTNDLDVETLRALEEALLAFPGCALVISHDRWFLDRVASHILAFEDSGEVVWHEGNYREYEDDFRRRTGAEPGVNRKARHKKLA
jgi:ATPase subunit of ABC transporter with duplicated ATPase domains